MNINKSCNIFFLHIIFETPGEAFETFSSFDTPPSALRDKELSGAWMWVRSSKAVVFSGEVAAFGPVLSVVGHSPEA